MVKLLGCDHANFPTIRRASSRAPLNYSYPRWIDPEPTAKLGIALALLDTAILGQGSSVQCQRFIASAKLLQACPISISELYIPSQRHAVVFFCPRRSLVIFFVFDL